MFNKKSLSALVVTVLLVAISIGIGTVLVNWVSSYSTSGINKAKQSTDAIDMCSRISFNVYNVNVVNPTATTNGSVSIFLDNSGTAAIDSMFLRVTDVNGQMYFVKPNEGIFHLAGLGKMYVHYNINTTSLKISCTSGCDIATLEFIPVVRNVNLGSDYFPCQSNHYTITSNEFRKANIV